MTASFAKTMERLPDEELFRIGYPDASDEYVGEAIAAAQAEIRNRGISLEEGRQIRHDIEHERGKRLPVSEEPLSKSGRVLSVVAAPLLGPMFIAMLIMWLIGYREKAFNMAAYMAIGLFGYFGLAVLIFSLLWLFG